jgi:glutamine amidotransferase-like uncharacterized protein
VCLAGLFLTACSPEKAKEATPILLFRGTGVSPGGAKAIEAVLKSGHLDYAVVDSKQINGMSRERFLRHRLLIVPGGNYVTIGNGLTPETAANIRGAVRDGLNYLGVCAGGILAGNCVPNGLNLTSGVKFDFYGAVRRGVHKAPVVVSGAGVPTLEHYWEDGPQFTGWGDVVGRFPDGTPAIVEKNFGKGFVVLCGVHPEAPEEWRHGMAFTTPAHDANAVAGALVDAALNAKQLPHD